MEKSSKCPSGFGMTASSIIVARVPRARRSRQRGDLTFGLPARKRAAPVGLASSRQPQAQSFPLRDELHAYGACAFTVTI